MTTSKSISIKHAHRLLNRASRRLRPQAIRSTPRVFCNPDMPSGWSAASAERATAIDNDIIVPARPLRAALA